MKGKVIGFCLLGVIAVMALLWVTSSQALPAQFPDQPQVEVGEPGLSFRYVDTFGETEVAYLADSDHLNYPIGVGIDSSDNLWVVETSGLRALKYDVDGGFLMSIGTAGLKAGDETFSSPRDVAVDAQGDIWVVDAYNNRVAHFNSSGEYQGALEGSDGDDFNRPRGIAIDSSGNIYVSDSPNSCIRIFDSSGVYTATLGEAGVPGSDNAHFDEPVRMAVDDTNLLYVADAANHRIQIFDVTDLQAISHVATMGETNVSGSDDTHFDWPMGVAVSGSRIFVADYDNSRVQAFDRSTRVYQATVGITGSPGTGNDQLKFPYDVVTDSAGNLYVADGDNHRVQKFDSSLTYQRTYGATGLPYLTDDNHYYTPYGVAVS